MSARPLVILGSARPEGETRKAVAIALPGDAADLIMLGAIAPYDYDHRYPQDGFGAAVDAMLAAQHIVFATPVYWYAMAAPLKNFFDRLTDLLEIDKPRGRALAGKQAWLIATGTDAMLPDGFEVPFSRTATYFSMEYRGGTYLHSGPDQALRAIGKAALQRLGAQLVAG